MVGVERKGKKRDKHVCPETPMRWLLRRWRRFFFFFETAAPFRFGECLNPSLHNFVKSDCLMSIRDARSEPEAGHAFGTCLGGQKQAGHVFLRVRVV